MTARVLVVEDEAEMQVILRDNLEYEGYEVSSAATGEEGVAIALRERPDVVLLDLMLPGMSGYEVCRKIRSNGLMTPIIMITARNAEIDRIAGLEFGADDYIGKPFNIRELLARIRVQLRHVSAGDKELSEFAFGNISVDLKTRQVWRDSRQLNLSATEFELLRYFISRRGEVVSREDLLTNVWGHSTMQLTRTVDNFVGKLRRRLEADPRNPRYIMTVYGSGYRFQV